MVEQWDNRRDEVVPKPVRPCAKGALSQPEGERGGWYRPVGVSRPAPTAYRGTRRTMPWAASSASETRVRRAS